VVSALSRQEGPAQRSAVAAEGVGWKTVAPGMELRFLVARKEGVQSNPHIAVLRIDPALWDLEVVGTSRTGESTGHTARDWCRRYNLTAAINAGMFGTDQKTHLGYLRYGEHVNNSHQNNYQSVAAFDQRDSARASRFQIFDLDAPGVTFQGILKDYASVVQNLRLVKRPGRNQWSQQERKWSEAALGEDRDGRILFIFSRAAFSMHDLNQELLASDIGLVAAQHLEGGPEAQLYLRAGETKLEMFGSYETSFREDDSNAVAWPVPNILGVRPRAALAHGRQRSGTEHENGTLEASAYRHRRW
jgi:hypothetical protein